MPGDPGDKIFGSDQPNFTDVAGAGQWKIICVAGILYISVNGGAWATLATSAGVSSALYLLLTGGTISGNLTITGTLGVTGLLTVAAGIAMGDTELARALLTDTAETVNALGTGSGARTIDYTLGQVVTATVNGITTWTFSNPPASGRAGAFTLVLTNGGSAAQTWPASVDWPGGVAPTLTAAGVDVLTFFTIDGGTTWRGVLAQTDSK